MTDHLLNIEDLTVSFQTDDGVFDAVEGVSLHVDAGEVVGLVGESGCGKSVTALSILRLIPSPPGKIGDGRVLFKGKNLLTLSIPELRKIRGNSITMIFQEPLSALSPLQRIGTQMVETVVLHREMDKKQAWAYAVDWLAKVRIPKPEEKIFAYPYHLSGGMQQRVMIAMALMLAPDLIIADEPTTALDVTIQAQIFSLIREMKQTETSLLLITHDMGVIWEMCDRVLVMYAANIVEEGTKVQIFEQPAHPYTRGLLQSIPKLGGKTRRLNAIPGNVPAPIDYPSGCHFRDRCKLAFDRCASEKPKLFTLGDEEHRAACFMAKKLINKPV